jgi:hypothetical protein
LEKGAANQTKGGGFGTKMMKEGTGPDTPVKSHRGSERSYIRFHPNLKPARAAAAANL